MTVVVATYASGTERLPLLIIGTSAMPVPFRAKADYIHWVDNKERAVDKPLFHYAH